MRYVIIGCSAAGVNAAAAIREADPDGEIVLVTREDADHYSRPMLSYYIAGTIDEDQLRYRGRDYLDRLGATLHTNLEIARIDAGACQVFASSGTALPYDRLLIACGGVARQPDIPGMDLGGVFHFRTLADARAIREWAARTRVCVTLGGGLVSIKAAEALRKRGVKEVHLVVGSNRVMSQAMDRGGAAFLERRLEANGVRARTGESVTGVLGENLAEGHGEVARGASLRSGDTIDCQMVLVGKGVRPDLSLARETGMETDWGILVDERMRTSVPGIYAAGDVAQAHDVLHQENYVNALWPLAAQQGWVAGCNMAGRQAAYPGWFAMNSLQVFGLPVITLGMITDGAKEGDGDLEILVHADERREVYRKLVLREGKLVGGALVGDTDASGLAGLMRSGVDVSAFKQDLLRKGMADFREVEELGR